MIKWGIIGAGAIAGKFASDLQITADNVLSAVGSRDKEKARRCTEQWGGQPFGSYEELLEVSDTDIIYIATPHHNHSTLAIKAMEAGKNVLVEKPAGVGARQVRDMLASAKANNVFFMEALWSRFRPAFQDLLRLVKSGEIGEVDFIRADFFYPLLDSPKARVLDPSLAGGALLDIGIYPIFLAYALLGKPMSIQALSQKTAAGIDIKTLMNFKYEHAMASLACGFTSKSEMTAEVVGTKGRVKISEPFHHFEKLEVHSGSRQVEIAYPVSGLGYSYEITHCAECLSRGLKESELWTWQDTLQLTLLLDEVRKEVGVRYFFEL